MDETGPVYLITYTGIDDPAPTSDSGATVLVDGQDMAPVTHVNIYVKALRMDGAVRVAGGLKTVSRRQNLFPLVECFLSKSKGEVTLSDPYSRGSSVFTLATGDVAATGAVVGDYFEVRYVDDALDIKRVYQSKIIVIVGDVITIACQIDFDLVPANVEIAEIVNVNMALASGTKESPVEFNLRPPNHAELLITRMTFDMILTTNPDDGLFGDIAALTNGIIFVSKALDLYQHLFVAFDNGDFRLSMFDVAFTTRSSGGGSYGVSARKTFAGEEKQNSMIRLHGNLDKISAIVQDNITGLVRMRVKVHGNCQGH